VTSLFAILQISASVARKDCVKQQQIMRLFQLEGTK
jgi:hypothetical protein